MASTGKRENYGASHSFTSANGGAVSQGEEATDDRTGSRSNPASTSAFLHDLRVSGVYTSTHAGASGSQLPTDVGMSRAGTAPAYRGRQSIMSWASRANASTEPYSSLTSPRSGRVSRTIPSPGRALHPSSRSRSRSPLNTRRSVTPFELDNWQALGDMISEDGEDDDDGESQGGGSGTTTPKANMPEPGQRPGPRPRNSLASLRSYISRVETEIGTIPPPRAIPERQDDKEPVTAGVLSTSPPQMNDTPSREAVDHSANRGDTKSDTGERLLNGVSNGVDRLETWPAGGPSEGSRLLDPQAEKEKVPINSVMSVISRNWPPSPVVIAILKCSLAYLIASLFTFVPQLSALLSMSSEADAHGRVYARPAYSAHTIATIVVYFNPAKTLGNMTLALRYCFFLVIGSSVICVCAMGTLELFDVFSPSQGSKWDWISEMGDWIVCVLWVGGSLGGLAWLKLWVGNPSFNSGCSMSAVIIYTVVIKEGAMPKVLEMLLIVSIGCCITSLVCILIFPSSATSRLQRSISKSLDSYSTLLELLTSTFLLEKAIVKENRPTLKEAIQSHSTALKTLKTDLAEAKHERAFDTRIRGRKLKLYDAAIASLARLAQHISGLRSSTRLQEGLVRAAKEGRISLDSSRDKPIPVSGSWLQSIALPGEPVKPSQGVDMTTSLKLFLQFRDIAGTAMDELVARCDDALDAVQALSGASSANIDLEAVRKRLAASITGFNQSASRAIKRLYAGPRRAKGLYDDDNSSSGDSDDDAVENLDSMPDGPNETVFLIYFFLFTLEEFSRELLFLLDTVNEIVTSEDVTIWGHIRSIIPSRRRQKQPRRRYLYAQLQQLVPLDPSKLQPPLFPRNQRDVPGTLLLPPRQELPVWAKFKQAFWSFGERINQPDLRYALKVGLAGAMLAAPAYTEVGRPIFMEYRGEWALIAFFATMSPTVGQTNFLSFFRVIGTLVGAAIAVLFYTLFPDNPIVLPILGWMISLPCFYVITQMPDYGQASRFTLLAYNLTCLYAYNSRSRDVEVTEIAIKRSTTVIIGTLWSAIVSRYWWPFLARRELRMGLSDFFLDLSYLYSKLVTMYSQGADPTPRKHHVSAQDQSHLSSPQSSSEGDALLPTKATSYGSVGWHTHLSPSVQHFMAMELHLQSQLNNLQDLLKHTKNEPRLKGPFAFGFYKEVLLSCERMLNRLHSMRCVTTRDEWDKGIRQAFVAPVNRQRREMAGNVILYFYTLSAGFSLRTPMPPYLPPAEQARQRLVQSIRGLDVVKRRSVRGGGRHLLFFAYALAMQEVIAELDLLGGMMQDAFGVISQSTVVDFEALFDSPHEGTASETSAGVRDSGR